VFRFKTPAASVTTPEQTPDSLKPAKDGGKGRPTPTRREAERRNRRPLVGAPPPPKGATKEERKAARAGAQAAGRDERRRSRAAMASGDERYLSARDKGPVRRFARDYIDSRRSIGEYFLPIALISLVVGVLNIPAARLISLLVLYVMVVVIAIDSFFLRRRVQRLVDEKFDGKGTAGVGTYALLRALQFRRGRMPKPQVQRGDVPKS
jgi:hypothetical protein